MSCKDRTARDAKGSGKIYINLRKTKSNSKIKSSEYTRTWIIVKGSTNFDIFYQNEEKNKKRIFKRKNVNR